MSSLFRENPLRSVIAATAAVGIGHFVAKFLVSPNASQWVQTLVAVIAIAALVFLIIMHHRQEGQLLTQPQEEAVLIGGLALLWVAIVVAWRASSSGGGDDFGQGYSRGSQFRMQKGFRGLADDPCPPGNVYCHIVEEYMY